MKISIISAYYNRKPLLEKTLVSINESMFKDFEFIVVDDGSDAEHEIGDLMNSYSFLTVIKIKKEDKKHTNPSIPFNIGIGIASGDIIVLQNPECYHLDDILTYVNDNLKENEYYSFSTYSINKEQTNRVLSTHNLTRNRVKEIISPIIPQVFHDFNHPGWYNHSIYRPKAYHFCAAIHKSNMHKLNGFDERYGNGIGYDDDEFLNRVMKLGLGVRIIDDKTVVHLFHEQAYQYVNSSELIDKNKRLFFQTMGEKTISVNNRNIFVR